MRRFSGTGGMSEFNRHDDEMGNLIGRIYNQMMGQPFPLRFLDEMEAFMMPKRTNGKSGFMKTTGYENISSGNTSGI
ncbi:MAG: hypothetical protein ACLSD6_03480 [Clostridium sp.]